MHYTQNYVHPLPSSGAWGSRSERSTGSSHRPWLMLHASEAVAVFCFASSQGSGKKFAFLCRRYADECSSLPFIGPRKRVDYVDLGQTAVWDFRGSCDCIGPHTIVFRPGNRICLTEQNLDVIYRAATTLGKPVRTIAFRSNRRAGLSRALGHPSIAHQSKPPNVRTKQASNKC
jgi:hypothetical protein